MVRSYPQKFVYPIVLGFLYWLFYTFTYSITYYLFYMGMGAPNEPTSSVRALIYLLALGYGVLGGGLFIRLVGRGRVQFLQFWGTILAVSVLLPLLSGGAEAMHYRLTSVAEWTVMIGLLLPYVFAVYRDQAT